MVSTLLPRKGFSFIAVYFEPSMGRLMVRVANLSKPLPLNIDAGMAIASSPSAKVILSRLTAPLKTSAPKSVMFAGMVMDVRAVHFWKHLDGILFTEVGSVAPVRAVQPSNVPSLSFLIVLGNATLVTVVLPLNTAVGTLTTVYSSLSKMAFSGITISPSYTATVVPSAALVPAFCT